MKNLNKENFFNKMSAECPEAMVQFNRFIEKYKKEVNWDKLFGPGIGFEDLPIELQNGIISRFEIDRYEHLQNALGQYRHQARELFQSIERAHIKRLKQLN